MQGTIVKLNVNIVKTFGMGNIYGSLANYVVVVSF